MRRRILIFFLPLFMLAACEVQSDIQGKYVDTQGNCRDEAEDKMAAMPGADAMTAKQRNAALVDRFSTCMIKKGWHVARPVKNPIVPIPPGTTKNPEEAALPAQPLPGQPSNVITSGVRQSSPPNEPVKTEQNALQPAPGQPALNEPAIPPAATYQPSYAPAYEPSPGRQF